MKNNNKPPARTARRTLAGDELAARILLHARDVLYDRGAAGFSVRKVADAAGISIGHLQHYYPTLLDLHCAIVQWVSQDFADYYADHVTAIDDPVDRLLACANYILERDEKKNHLALLREYWVLAMRDEQISALLTRFYAACRELAEDTLLDANAQLGRTEARRRGCVAVSLLSGAFLYTNPSFDGTLAEEFRNHVRDEIRRLPFNRHGELPAA
ncbi:MAG: TetR/AcrR family transcriptional regulator [Woeseia sp.]